MGRSVFWHGFINEPIEPFQAQRACVFQPGVVTTPGLRMKILITKREA